MELQNDFELDGTLNGDLSSSTSSLNGSMTNVNSSKSNMNGSLANQTLRGYSAYQVAVSEGFEGTETEWLESLKGEQGEVGPIGPKGEPGIDGKDGLQGPKGETGPQGPKGDKGDPGEPGKDGKDGPKGDTGATGPQGIQGPQGEKGDTGATGPQGLQGEQGIQGPQGEPGKDGTDATVTSTSIQNALGYKPASQTDIDEHLADTTKHITSIERTIWNNKSDFSGSYNDLTDKPIIPSLSGYATETYVNNYAQPKGDYLTQHQDLSSYAKKTDVTEHNTAEAAHNDIRLLIEGLTARLNALADSDDKTLDQMSEIVAYIKANKALIENVTTVKVNVSDIIDNLTTSVTDRPLSAKQGAVLKSLIDNEIDKLSEEIAKKQEKGNYASSSHAHAISDVTNLQSTLNGKASSSHTHDAKNISFDDNKSLIVSGTNVQDAIKHIDTWLHILEEHTLDYTQHITTTEEWTFTLEDGSTVTKKVVLG